MKTSRYFPLLALIFSASMNAAVIIDTGPATGTEGIAFGNIGPLYNQAFAGQFTLTSGKKITAISTWLGDVPLPGNLHIAIDSEFDSLPGPALFQDSVHVDGSYQANWQGISGLSWQLDPGTYWVMFSSPDLITSAPALPEGAGGNMPSEYAEIDAKAFPGIWNVFPQTGNWDYRFGVQIFGDDVAPPLTPVPESSTYGLFASFGLLGLALRKRWLTQRT